MRVMQSKFSKVNSLKIFKQVGVHPVYWHWIRLCMLLGPKTYNRVSVTVMKNFDLDGKLTWGQLKILRPPMLYLDASPFEIELDCKILINKLGLNSAA